MRKNLNFFRVHLLFFTFIPLLASAVLYASNGKYPISYVDALFNSVSAMTVCGLSTVNLSSLTPWQQVILFLQMCVGSPVGIRTPYFFAKKFDHIIAAEAARRLEAQLTRDTSASRGRDFGWPRRVSTLFQRRPGLSPLPENGLSAAEDVSVSEEKEGDKKFGVRMIRRMDAPPRLVNPSGRITEAGDTPDRALLACPNGGNHMSSPPPSHPFLKSNTFHEGPEANERARRMSKAANVEFSPTVGRQDTAYSTGPDTTWGDGTRQRRPTVVSIGDHVPLGRNPTIHTHRTVHTVPRSDGYPELQHPQSVYTDFGGFPMPHKLLGKLLGRLFPKAQVRLHRTMTIPATTSFTGGSILSHGRRGSLAAPDGAINTADGTKPATYISFHATVGRNSAFRSLTNGQLEELGGVEYRALNALLWLVASYHFGIQIISYVVIAPYMSMSKWSSDFTPPALQRPVAPAWFSLFQVVSAYTNTGMSLVDQSMVPFQTAYPMIFFMIICILAGNTAFVSSWVVTKIIPRDSRLNETLHFLLDHPRRCFIYLFPSHQTWFLLTMLFVLNITDWLSFLIFDIGNSAISSIPVGTRIVAGFYQAIAVRNAGFGIVPLALLAPATKVMYVIMMYISVCDVRSTNVYEERSLGIFPPDEEDVGTFRPTGSRVAIWGHYLGMHARRQLSFDMWWLSLALFVVCIIERDNLNNPNIQGWFNIFTIIFELVSAYGSVGLSLGVPDQNYSFSGALRPLSKLVVTLVMLRGRHRGLPVAIDRAVMLPSEFRKPEEDPDLQHTTDERTRASRLYSRKLGGGGIRERRTEATS
ncbi:cation transport protein-domain-containing protein [Pisolithus orientalis]|uniref:cation transport protein-domain-containing protein n=1 Tax=Pisolithus orientalis TaxID=936130 RepID=UPI0022251A2F|nr:cation transport protein-domain-containing protein [Pisolithus orientalis]KAI6007608.1 cation transport protein-domain-containing protein [Pisolithus orientalis]